MSDEKPSENNAITPPSRAMDLEYSEAPPLRGIEVKCPHCRNALSVPFFATARAFSTLVDAIAGSVELSARALLREDSTRPPQVLLHARALLAQAVLKLAGDGAETVAWFCQTLGWSHNRTTLALGMNLNDVNEELAAYLERLRSAIEI